ncbi:MAG: S1 RNA-binding domain-containing protein [Candidatus Sumerlaeota bacterium]
MSTQEDTQNTSGDNTKPSTEAPAEASGTPADEKKPEQPEEAKASAPKGPEPADVEQEMEEFDSLIGDYLDGIAQHEVSSVVDVQVVDVGQDVILVDMGDKAEGMIHAEEFIDNTGKTNIQPGDKISVMVLGRDEDTGRIEVSYRQARHIKAWETISEAHTSGNIIKGTVSRTVKGGMLVNINGTECFMPASHVSDRRVNNLDEWVGKDVEVKVIELNERNNRAVVSRREPIEERKRAQMKEVMERLQEGETVQGTVRSVQNFGAFLDIGGIDAFLPREEISWDRGARPDEILREGEQIKVQIINLDYDSQRVKVSRKALRQDPWVHAESKYPKDQQVKGEVTGTTRYGAFVRVEEGITGLIHISDLTWTKQPGKVTDFVKEGDMVEAVVIDLDTKKQRLSLGLKQMVEDPWVEAERQFPKGSKIKGEVTGLTSFGAFVKLADNVEGLIHVSDFSWTEHVKDPSEKLKEGDEVEAVVLKTDRESRRISLGIKQMTDSPMKQFLKEHPVGSTIEGTVARLIPIGAFLTLVPAEENGGRAIDGFMHVSQIDTEHVEKPEEALKEGEKIEVKITKVERGGERISLSRKALLEAEERKAIKEFRADPRESKGVMKLGELLQDIQIGESGLVEEVPEEKKAAKVEEKAEEQTEAVSAPVKEVTDEPAKAEDVSTEPAPVPTTEPTKAEDVTTEPAQQETTEPVKAEEARTEAAKPEETEAVQGEEASTEPAEPEASEAAKTEEASTESAKEEDTAETEEKEQ